MRSRLRLLHLVIGAVFLSASGCGLLIGNTRPVAEKSETYVVDDLPKKNPDWIKLESESGSRPDTSDLAYRSKTTQSIIALNSACRASFETQPHDLRVFTDQLVLGVVSKIAEREEEPTTIADTLALRTRLKGTVNHQTVKIQTLVLRRGPCIYDLMFIAKPTAYASQEEEFNRFVATFKFQ